MIICVFTYSSLFQSYFKTRATSIRSSNYHHRLLRKISPHVIEMAKTLAPKSREVPASILGWSVIFATNSL